MTNKAPIQSLRRLGSIRPLAGIILLGAAFLAAALGHSDPSVARGWLVAFAVWSCIPIGSMVLLLVHSLTGGRWGSETARLLRPSAALTVMAAIAIIPALAMYGHVYPWAHHGYAGAADVEHWYLNWPAYLLRSALTLAGWSLLGVIFAMGKGRPLFAGLGLAFYGATISLVAVDWYLSVEPRYVATAFPAMIAVQQLTAALAFVAVLSPELDERASSDIGALLLAALLGVVYLEFMTYLIAWYGDLPDKAEWYLKREGGAWSLTIVLAFALGAVLPFCILLSGKQRRSRDGLRRAGALVLLGTILHVCWLIVPAFDQQRSVLTQAAAAFVALAVSSLLIGGALRQVAEAHHAQR